VSAQKLVRIIEVVPHNVHWAEDYRYEADKIEQIFGEEMVEIHHIGSTAIPGIYAKPTIDFLAGVKDIRRVDVSMWRWQNWATRPGANSASPAGATLSRG
jgi:GrpB-like predicted nucleotidyltransferase (UPF0157 family)